VSFLKRLVVPALVGLGYQPIVIVRSRGKSNPTLDEVLAEYHSSAR